MAQTFLPVALSWLLKYYGNTAAVAAAYPAAAAQAAFLATVPPSAIEGGLGDWMALEDKVRGKRG